MAAIPEFVTVPMKDFVEAQLIVNCVIVFVVLSVVGLRVYARLTGPGLGLDDLFVTLALPLGIGMLVAQGFLSQMSFCMEIIYVPCLAFAKVSMLFFYRRVFSTPLMLKAVDVMLGIVAAWTICFECTCIFLCHPVSGFWTGTGKCGAFVPMIQSLIATNALGDLIIMIMPMSTIWGLQMRKTERLALMSCFALGLACIVIAIFRVVYLAKVNLAGDVTGTMPATVFLFALEPNLAILCVSIPMLRPLYSRYRSRYGSRGGSGSKPPSSGGLRTFGTLSNVSGGRKKRVEDATTWEMHDYYVQRGGGAAAAVGDSGEGEGVDETGSEKSLTGKTRGQGISVETKWSITRS